LEISMSQRLRRRFGINAICLAVLAGGDDTVRSVDEKAAHRLKLTPGPRQSAQ